MWKNKFVQNMFLNITFLLRINRTLFWLFGVRQWKERQARLSWYPFHGATRRHSSVLSAVFPPRLCLFQVGEQVWFEAWCLWSSQCWCGEVTRWWFYHTRHVSCWAQELVSNLNSFCVWSLTLNFTVEFQHHDLEAFQRNSVANGTLYNIN